MTRSQASGATWPESLCIDQVARAQAIATVAHHEQVDKLGEAYLAHPAAVAGAFDPAQRPVEHCAGWLHDVVEDTGISLGDLEAAGVEAEVRVVVDLLTRRRGQGDEYYRRIAANPAARAVKLADIAHNLSPERTARLSEADRARLAEKYEHAKRLLGVGEPRGGVDA